MENGDIGLLRYCFSAAGQKNQKETADWLQKVSDCLQNAGAGKVFMDEKKDEILFRVNHRKASEKKDIIEYRVKIIPGSSQLTLVQTNLWENEAQAKKLMCWYAAKRNERLTHDIQYSINPVQLKGKVILRNGWETELIRRTGEMNRIVMNDREIFEALSRGKVPDCIQNQVRQEYQEYEREIRHGVDI